MPTVMVGAALGLFAYVAGRADFSTYLFMPHIPGAGELTVVCAAIAGPAWAFSGSTRIRPKCSWATSVRWRSAPRWARSR
jgi:phospho-N-acetylmuramoyl-pentapeptide-transferase